MDTSPQTSEKNIIVLQLERKRKAVEQLLQKLDSYRCTPKTQSLYEKREDLKTGLDDFALGTEELLSILKSNGIELMHYVEDVERRFEEFNALHQEVEAYIATTRG